MFGQLSKNEIDQLISTQLVGRIGCHADGLTYVVPMSYAWDGVYIYGHSYEGKKLEIMRRHPRICFEVDNTRNLANWQSVIGWGNFEELKDSADREFALQKLNERALPYLSSETMHITPQWPFPSESMSEIKGVFFRVKLDEITGRFEQNSQVNDVAFNF